MDVFSTVDTLAEVPFLNRFRRRRNVSTLTVDDILNVDECFQVMVDELRALHGAGSVAHVEPEPLQVLEDARRNRLAVISVCDVTLGVFVVFADHRCVFLAGVGTKLSVGYVVEEWFVAGSALEIVFTHRHRQIRCAADALRQQPLTEPRHR